MGPEKQVLRFAMASQSKLSIFLHVVEEERGAMNIGVLNGLHRVRRERSITRAGLDGDQLCVRLSMRSLPLSLITDL